MVERNPFKPSFGSPPPLLVGRDDLVELFGSALDDGPGAPGRATLYTGARGVGKTVMLTEAEEEARKRGWLVISETATPGLLERIVRQHLPGLIATFDGGGTRRRRLTGFSIPGLGGVTFTPPAESSDPAGLRPQLDRITDMLSEHRTGLLITVDELHRHLADDLRALVTAVQHAFREERELAFVGAGLPHAVGGLLDDQVLTFLRRADRHVLGGVAVADVSSALRRTFEESGRTIASDVCDAAADATGGYPFLIQLVGYHVWRQHPANVRITGDDLEAGVAAARRRVGALVVEPTLADLSEVDRSFLVAMARDDDGSRVADIADRLGVNANYAGQYRLRLIQAELIEPAGHGEVRFALPYLRDYLREHAAALGLGHLLVN